MNQRCFIIGNGPSIRNQNLSQLSNEIVFTCNQIARYPGFERMKTNYHFWADRFNHDTNQPEDMEIFYYFKAVSTKGNSPKIFLTYENIEFVKNHKMDDFLEISYFMPGIPFCENFKLDLDFTSAIPTFRTVIQYQIAMAIYMGFKEIYLLGCESTVIMNKLNARLNNSLGNAYAYELTSNEQMRINKVICKGNVEKDLAISLKVFSDYRKLNSYCTERNIKLINCTPGGLIDSLPRRTYENVMNPILLEP